MAEATNVGAIYFDLVIRGSLEKQIQEIAAKGQAFANKAFSGMEKSFASMANSITKQTVKPVEKFADTMAKSSEKMTDCFKKVSATPAEKTLRKAQEQADKAAEKVKELENVIGKLNEAVDSRIAEDIKTFSESVEDAQRKVDYLAEQIVDVKSAMEKKPSQTLSQTLKMLIGQYSVAKDALKTEQAILEAQRKTAEKNVEATFSKQREKLYEQLAAARERSAARAAQAAQLQASAEIIAAQQTTAAIQAERAKQTATQSAFSDPTEEVRARMQAFSEHLREDAQKAIDNSVWNRLSQYAQTFGNVARDAFSKANGSAVSFGQIASQAFTEAGGAAGMFGGKIAMIITIARTAGNVISGVFQKVISKVKESFSKAKTVILKVNAAISKFTGKFNIANKTTKRFVSRLREIATGALFFNGISAALRSMTEYMGEALSVSEEMRSAWANLKGAAANAASPLIQALTPALVTLANAAAVALTYVERLVTWITGKTSNAAETASKIAEKNAKKAQRYLASFDQLNRLDKKDEEEDDEIKPNYNFKGFNSFLESLLNAIKAGRWTRVGELIAEKLNETLAAIPWDTILQKAKQWTQNFVDVLNGFIHKVDWGLIGVTLGQGLNTLLTVIDTFFQGVDWVSLGTNLAAGVNNLIITVDWPMLGRVLSDKLKALFDTFHGFVNNFDFKTLGTKIGEMLKAAFGNINWQQLAADLNTGIVGLLDTLIAFVQHIEWDKVRQTINDCLEKINWSAIGNKVGELLCSIQWGEIIGTVWDVITEYWKAKWELFWGIVIGGIKEFGENLIDHFKEVGLSGIKSFLDGLKNPISTIASWLAEHLVNPVINAVKDLFGIHSPSAVFAEIGGYVAEGLFKGIADAISNAGSWLKENLVDPLVNSVKNLFGIHSPSTVFAGIGKNLVDGLDLGISKNWDKVTDTVGDGSEEVEDEVSDKWEKLFNKTEKAWTAMAVMTDKLFKKVETSIQKHTSSAEKSATSSANSIATDTNQSWSQMNSNATSAFNRLSSKIMSAWTSLRSSMSSISWNNVGDNMVAGLNNGITSAWGRLMANVRNLASQLTDAVNSAWKINSPSKVFYDIGQYLDAGLENGILDGRRRLLGTVSGIAAAVTDSMKIQTPYLSNGGIIQQPSLAMIGGHSGARSNPEIVTPQSHMSETVSDVMEYAMRDVVSNMMSGLGALLEEQRLTRQAVESIEISDSAIGHAAARYSKAARNRLGHFNY